MRLLLPLALLTACRAELDSKPDGLIDSQPVSILDGDHDGFSAEAGDCDDANTGVYPGAPEICNEQDDDCDGQTDEDVQLPFYADSDQDGYGDPSTEIFACNAPEGHVTDATDCNDQNLDIHPDAPERCNTIDDDCDGLIDEDITLNWYEDADLDGYGDPSTATLSCDPPSGYVANGDDCDDTTERAAPGLPEVCDLLDNDCNGLTDDGVAPTWYADFDGDNYGSSLSQVACAAPAGYTATPGDCDDNNVNINPGADELCNAQDDNCNGLIDEGNATDAPTWYPDTDQDGYGDPSAPTLSCAQPAGYVADNTDCDDILNSVNPAADEYCNSIDDNCDGQIDEDTAIDAPTWYADGDMDGYGDNRVARYSCSPIAGYVLDNTDCNDGAAAANPGQAEICDRLDNNCDGTIDEDTAIDAQTWYLDGDNDNFGDPQSPTTACTRPSGYTANSQDCDDTDLQIYPGAPEYCNNLDDDCDGQIDDNAIDAQTWYTDSDQDGYGDPNNTIDACTQPTTAVATGTDCNDRQASTHPNAGEICDNIDNDCDGAIDENASNPTRWYFDADSDGYGNPAIYQDSCSAPAGYVTDNTDCNDLRRQINPGATEFCNGVDDNCDGQIDENTAADVITWYLDLDDDGYGSTVTTQACDRPDQYSPFGGDCNDANIAFNPGAIEMDCADPNDYNCDGSTGYVNLDGDAFAACEECDDTDANNYPGALEYCDGTDNNCDGQVDEDAVDALTWYLDADGDSYGNPNATLRSCQYVTGYLSDNTDCNDGVSTVHPNASEYCNGVDDDCDGQTDENAVDFQTWYIDPDADGYGASTSTVLACSLPSGYAAVSGDCNNSNAAYHPNAAETDCTDPNDYNCDGTVVYANADGDAYAACVDCNDNNAAINPAATETCNSIDDNCDGSVDNNASNALTWYSDTDADGYGNSGSTTRSCTQPAGYVVNAADCNDAANSIHPGATETCNNLDDDCDGAIDDNAVGLGTWYRDADSDGYGSTTSTLSCNQPSGYVSNAQDCNDSSAAISPAATEICNNIDDDCDGSIDETTGSSTVWYRDADSDGYGSSGSTTRSCSQPAGYVASSTDCNDGSAAIHPNATEICNSIDDDCDGAIDESGSSGSTTWYRDADGDGYGNSSSTTSSCNQPSGYVASASDCNDSSSGINPAASDICDGIDNNCSGYADDAGLCPCTVLYYGTKPYMFCTGAQPWTTAAGVCSYYGYNLLTVNSSAENTWAVDNAYRYYYGKWWTGGNDRASEGSWTWYSGQSWSYSSWHSGEPNNVGSNGEDCMQLGRFLDYTWNDEPCDSAFRYICEGP